MSEMMVSVCMITYNHEAFIREAIEGVLMQQTSFPIELVIGEDCSTDRTRTICEEYAETHPEIIRLLPSEKNLGMMPNFMQTLKACTGKYIALCEGDDYWTDPMKLQKQVEFLEGNDLVLCHTKAKNSDGKLVSKNNSKNVDQIEELIEGNFIVTATTLLKRSVINEIDWIGKYPFGDWCLWITAATMGKIGYLDDETAVYRINQSGVWQNNWEDRIGKSRILAEILFLKDFCKWAPQYKRAVRKSIILRLKRIAKYNYESLSFRLNINFFMIKNSVFDKELAKIIIKSGKAYFLLKIGL